MDKANVFNVTGSNCGMRMECNTFMCTYMQNKYIEFCFIFIPTYINWKLHIDVNMPGRILLMLRGTCIHLGGKRDHDH